MRVRISSNRHKLSRRGRRWLRSRCVGWVFLGVATLAAVQGRAQTDGVAAHAWTDSSDYRVGDWITVHLKLKHPPGSTFRWLVGDTIGGYSVLERLPFTRESDSSTSGGVVVARYDSVTAILPPMTVLFSLQGDTASQSVQTNPVVLTVHTVPVDPEKDIKDLKPPLSIPLTLAEIALSLGVLLLCVALIYLGYRYWKNRKQTAMGEVYVPPPRPAHIIALEELARLKDRKLWQQGRIKQYYSELTNIFRRYFEHRYSMRALEETTDEIMADLKTQRLAPEVLHTTDTILRRADLVKFAKFQPDIAEHEETMARVHDVVERTKFVAMTSVPAAEAKGGGHVGN